MSSLALRLRRICSSDETFKLRTNELKTYLNKRGFNLSFFKKEIRRVNGIPRSRAGAAKRHLRHQPTYRRVPLVITYTSTSFLHLPPAPTFSKPHPGLVAFRLTNNLSDLLVSGKLRNPTQNNPGIFSMRRQLSCNYITDGRTSYTFHSTLETRHITYHIDRNSKNVINMGHCNRCHKQYIGETKQRFKDRFN